MGHMRSLLHSSVNMTTGRSLLLFELYRTYPMKSMFAEYHQRQYPALSNLPLLQNSLLDTLPRVLLNLKDIFENDLNEFSNTNSHIGRRPKSSEFY